jgi:hypothetical protein
MRAAIDLAGSGSAALLLILCVSAQAAEPRVIEYLSVEANEGGSSGGHAAIRFDDTVYHFLHHAPGVLRLHREDANGFLFTYSLLQNRGVAVSRIAVSDDTYDSLRSWFNRRYLTEGMEFDALDALSGDRSLIELLLRRTRNPDAAWDRDPLNGVALRGAGYFFADGSDDPGATGAAPLVTLRRRVHDRYGADFLRLRRAELRAALTQLTPVAAGSSFSRSYTNLMTALLAVAALERTVPLQADSFDAPANDAFRLRANEQAALGAFADQLEEELLALLRSPRPDWGFPMLVGMARLVAVRESVRTGRLVVLDAFGPHAAVVPPAAWRGREAMMADLLDEARGELDSARSRLTSGEPLREGDMTRLETAGNRFNELFRGLTEFRDVRVQSGLLLPSRVARRTDLILPVRSAADLEQDLGVAQQRERTSAQELQQRYAYNLITRNCVSEVFHGLNDALTAVAARDALDGADDRAQMSRLHAASQARLGGYIEPGAALTFIPFVSTRAVRDTYNVTETQQLPSYRSRRLAAMYQRENPVVVFLRESNTLTSTVYGPNPRDSFFLFFTDALPMRPLLGSANLIAGLGASAVGLALLPLDGGRVFLSGVKGALFSLPELGFVHLRKGTFDYVERAYRPMPAAALPAG